MFDKPQRSQRMHKGPKVLILIALSLCDLGGSSVFFVVYWNLLKKFYAIAVLMVFLRLTLLCVSQRLGTR